MATVKYEQFNKETKTWETKEIRLRTNSEVIACAKMKLLFPQKVWENEIIILSFNGSQPTAWRWV